MCIVDQQEVVRHLQRQWARMKNTGDFPKFYKSGDCCEKVAEYKGALIMPGREEATSTN